jgi:hypothetical protein
VRIFCWVLRTLERAGAMRRRALRAAPRAVCVVTAIRLQSLTPARLRHCALRLPPGDLRQAHPRRAMIGAPVREPNRLAPDRPGRRPAAMGRALRRIRRGLLRQVVRMRVVLDAGGSRLSRHEGWFTAQRPASLWSFHTTPQWRRRRVGQGRSRPSSGCCLGPRQGASQ